MSNLSIKEREMEFNKLCIYPIKGVAKHILCMTEHISNGNNFKIKPIDSNFDKKQIAYCPDLPFGIISFNSFVNIKTMNIIFSDVEVNDYELKYEQKYVNRSKWVWTEVWTEYEQVLTEYEKSMNRSMNGV